MIAFGPVPSRRLGRSVGINNIPPKLCTYSCAYCQVGRTTEMRVGRVSDVSNQLPPGFIRVSVGAREENDAFLATFLEIREIGE